MGLAVNTQLKVLKLFMSCLLFLSCLCHPNPSDSSLYFIKSSSDSDTFFCNLDYSLCTHDFAGICTLFRLFKGTSFISSPCALHGVRLIFNVVGFRLKCLCCSNSELADLFNTYVAVLSLHLFTLRRNLRISRHRFWSTDVPNAENSLF
jgi:hypothetical protein